MVSNPVVDKSVDVVGRTYKRKVKHLFENVRVS